jgi:hypothetical protein
MPPKQPARKINGVTARTITAGIAAMNTGYVEGEKLDWISSVSLILEEERTKINMIGGGVIDTFFFHSRISLVILKQTKKISANSSHHFVP